MLSPPAKDWVGFLTLYRSHLFGIFVGIRRTKVVQLSKELGLMVVCPLYNAGHISLHHQAQPSKRTSLGNGLPLPLNAYLLPVLCRAVP